MLQALLAGMVSIALLSWDFKQSGDFYNDKINASDTIPKNKEKKIRDLDDVLIELDEAQVNLDKELKLNMEKIKVELEEAMKKMDKDKLKLEIEQSIKEVDIEKIRKDVEASIAKIDWDKMKAELEKVKEIDLSKMELDMAKMQKELEKIGPEIENSMEKAKESIEKVKAEMKEYKNFVDGLEKDKLLDRKKGYTIKHNDGELFINGKKQPAEIYNKYRSFLEKHKNFNIEKSDDDFNIDID